jgi:uncharacterized protein (DUF2345 family)
VAFLGSPTAHGGSIVTGSGNILVGSAASSAPFTAPAALTFPGQDGVEFRALEHSSGQPIAGQRYELETAEGNVFRGTTDSQGMTSRMPTKQPEKATIRWIF